MPPKRVVEPRTPSLGALGRAIEQQRRAAGLSQEELAARSDIHSTHISGLERGVRNPTYESLRQVADGLGITVGQLTSLADKFYADASVL